MADSVFGLRLQTVIWFDYCLIWLWMDSGLRGIRIWKRKWWPYPTYAKVKSTTLTLWKRPSPTLPQQSHCMEPILVRLESGLFPTTPWTFLLPFLPIHFLLPRMSPLLPSPPLKNTMQPSKAKLSFLLWASSDHYSQQSPDLPALWDLVTFTSHVVIYSHYYLMIMCILQCSVAI